MQKYNVLDKHTKYKLSYSKRFTKYPDIFLSNTCTVKVNPDDCLLEDEFIIQTKNAVLPRKIYVYGKKGEGYGLEDNIYLNYWLPVFLKTIEKGYLVKNDFEKVTSNAELSIGLSSKYRKESFKYNSWTRNNIIDFLSCLFGIDLLEGNYQQQDLLEEFTMAA